MKLNNKGFAISAVLYSVLILFMLILVSYLTILSGTKKFNTKTLSSINEVMKEEVIEINKVLNIEIEKDGLTGLGNMKHWHIFNVIAKKKY